MICAHMSLPSIEWEKRTEPILEKACLLCLSERAADLERQLAELDTEIVRREAEWQQHQDLCKEAEVSSARKRHELEAKLAEAQATLPCRHHKSLDDSYGGCLLCMSRQGYEEYERENIKLEQESDALKATLEQAREALRELAKELRVGARELYYQKAVLACDRDWLLAKAQKAEQALAALEAGKEAGG